VLPIDGSPGVEVVQGKQDLWAEWSPAGTRLAYSAYDGAQELWTVEPDGSDPQLLGSAGYFLWSPVGDRLAGNFDGGVGVAAADGSWSETVSDGQPLWLAWAPDGSRFAYVTWEISTNETTLYSCPATGLSPLALSGPDVFVEDPFGTRKPAWAPDGSRIAYCSGPSGSMLNVVRSDVADSVAVPMPGGSSPYAGAVWSSDSRFFAVTVIGGGLRILNADGSPEWTSDLEVWGSAIAWRPDERVLAAATTEGIVLFDLPWRQTRVLKPAGGASLSAPFPVWSPNGDTLAVTTFPGEPLWTWSGGPSLRLTGNGGVSKWSSDSRTLYTMPGFFDYDALVAFRAGRESVVLEGEVVDFDPR
jgi:Tol biopolymer transport system component